MKDKCQISVKIMRMLTGKTCLGCVYGSFANHAEITNLQTFTCNIHIFKYHHVPRTLRVVGVRDAAGLSLLVMMALCQFIPAKDLLRT